MAIANMWYGLKQKFSWREIRSSWISFYEDRVRAILVIVFWKGYQNGQSWRCEADAGVSTFKFLFLSDGIRNSGGTSNHGSHQSVEE